MMEQLRNALKHVVLFSFYLSHHRNKECYHTGDDGGGWRGKWNQMFSKDTSKNVSGDLRMMLTWQQILSRSSTARGQSRKDPVTLPSCYL